MTVAWFSILLALFISKLCLLSFYRYLYKSEKTSNLKWLLITVETLIPFLPCSEGHKVLSNPKKRHSKGGEN